MAGFPSVLAGLGLKCRWKRGGLTPIYRCPGSRASGQRSFDRLRSYSNGYDMAEALGYAWACDCRGRSPDSAQKKGPLSIHRATPRSALPQSSICLECMIHAAGQGAMTLER
ncbi:hypothetical protein F6X37_03005 [Paraburkholderia sp. 31.1]|nr:hypothetical protein [Paraburkholderia sp. 31.1]